MDIDLPARQQKCKLCELTGIIAWSEVASDILTKGYAHESSSFDWEIISNYIEQLEIDWDKNGQYLGRTGLVGGKAIGNDLRTQIHIINTT